MYTEGHVWKRKRCFPAFADYTSIRGNLCQQKSARHVRVRVGLMALPRVRRAISLPRWRRARYFWPDKRFLSLPPPPWDLPSRLVSLLLTGCRRKKKKKIRIVDEIYAILLCLLINFSIIGVRLSLPVLTVSRIEFFFSLFLLYSFEYLIRENIEWFNCDFWESTGIGTRIYYVVVNIYLRFFSSFRREISNRASNYSNVFACGIFLSS